MSIRTMWLCVAAAALVLLLMGTGLIAFAISRNVPKQPAGIAASGVRTQNPNEEMTLRKTWSLAGSWRGVACDSSSGEIYALNFGGTVVRLDATGQELGRLRLQSSAGDRSSLIRLANLSGGRTPDLITFDSWGRAVRAYDPTGKVLWEYAEPTGVDDVWVAPGSKGARDRIIIGYNGGTGLHLLNSDGTLHWKHTNIGNVWHVCAGPTGQNGRQEIVTTSASGQVHLFDPSANLNRTLRAGSYSHMVRIWTPPDNGTPSIITCDSGSPQIIAIDPSGTRLWATSVPTGSSGHLIDAACSNSHPWFATTDGNIVSVYDVRSGNCLASGALGGSQIAWTSTTKDRPPQLVVAASSLVAYELQPKESPATPASKQP